MSLRPGLNPREPSRRRDLIVGIIALVLFAADVVFELWMR